MSIAIVFLAAVQLASPFADGMVLQRDMPVCVWGSAAAGQKVRVEFAGACAEAVAGPDGRWQAELPPMKASREGRTLSANGTEIRDVLVGEVWLCSGQSNADCPIWGENPRYRDGWGMSTLLSTRKPHVRFVRTPSVMSAEPRRDVGVKWRKGKILNLDGSAGRIKGRDIVVSADGLSGSRKLRYLHSHPWFGALYSDACLPLGAFHIGEP